MPFWLPRKHALTCSKEGEIRLDRGCTAYSFDMEMRFRYVQDMASFAHIFDCIQDRQDHALCGYGYKDPVELKRGQRPRRLCRACQALIPQAEAVHWRQVAAKSKANAARLARQQRMLIASNEELRNDYEQIRQAYEGIKLIAENQRLELKVLREPGPTSLLAAMTDARIPADNHTSIRQFTEAVGIAEYYAIAHPDNPYVRATRRAGKPDLHIHYGYTTGFRSSEEIDRVAGSDTARGRSLRQKAWYVEHPINRGHPERGRSRDVRRAGEFCTCGLQLSLTGVCVSCD